MTLLNLPHHSIVPSPTMPVLDMRSGVRLLTLGFFRTTSGR